MGYLPEAMLNHLALSGWNPGTDEEWFTLDELVERFTLDRCSPANAVYDRDKLLWMNGATIRLLPVDELARRLLPWLAGAGVLPSADLGPGAFSRLSGIVALEQERLKTLADAPEAELEAAFARAAAQPICKGFAVGRSIFGSVAEDWLGGRVDDSGAINIGAAGQPPKCRNSLHSHRTAEVFFVLSGRWRFFWGRWGTAGEVVLAQNAPVVDRAGHEHAHREVGLGGHAHPGPLRGSASSADRPGDRPRHIGEDGCRFEPTRHCPHGEARDQESRNRRHFQLERGHGASRQERLDRRPGSGRRQRSAPGSRPCARSRGRRRSADATRTAAGPRAEGDRRRSRA